MLTERTAPLLLTLLCIATFGCDLVDINEGPSNLGAAPPIGAPPSTMCESVILNDAEQALYQAVNRERWKRNIPEIRLSPSLTTVAQFHADDAASNPILFDEMCDLHSWSTSSDWSGCCYTSNQADAACMWNKPAEITGFAATGYELAYRGFGNINIAVENWLSSPAHRDVLLNENDWAPLDFQSIGVGVAMSEEEEVFAYVWLTAEAECQD